MTPLQRMRASRRTFETHESRVDGCRVLARRSTVEARNDAPTVLLIGATALSGRYLLPVGVEMAGRYPVWVPDLPGRGASESPKKVLSVEENAELLAAWMDVAGIDRAAVLANSMGCQIAVELAVRHPRRVSHLVLQGPTTDPRARTAVKQLVRLVRMAPHEPPSLGPIEFVDWVRTGPRTAVASARAALGHHIEDRLPLLSCPALVVRGTRDTVAPSDWAQRMADLIPDGRLREVPGASHSMVYSNALELARVSDGFLQQAVLRGEPRAGSASGTPDEK